MVAPISSQQHQRSQNERVELLVDDSGLDEADRVGDGDPFLLRRSTAARIRRSTRDGVEGWGSGTESSRGYETTESMEGGKRWTGVGLGVCNACRL
jgi:hypothetical protein